MGMSSAYTLTEAKEVLSLWKECYRALAEGHAKSYKVGSREYTAFDLPEVTKQIETMSNVVESLNGQARTSRVVRVVPRDL